MSSTRTLEQDKCFLHASMTMHPPVPECGVNCNKLCAEKKKKHWKYAVLCAILL